MSDRPLYICYCATCGWAGARCQVLLLVWPEPEFICFGCASWSQQILVRLH